MSLLKQARYTLKDRYPDQAAALKQGEENYENALFYAVYIGSRHLMHALNVTAMRPPIHYEDSDRPGIYRLRPGDTHERVCHRNDLSDFFDIQHPDLKKKKRASLMLPDSQTTDRAISLITPYEQEITQNPIDSLYICLDSRITQENLTSLMALAKVQGGGDVPIYCVQGAHGMDPTEGRKLLEENVRSLKDLKVTGTFLISDEEDTAAFQKHLNKTGVEVENQARKDLEKKAIEILKACRHSCIEKRRFLHVSTIVFPPIPTQAIYAQRLFASRVADIKNELLRTFRINLNGGKSLIDEILAFAKGAKTEAEWEGVALRAVGLINKWTLDAVVRADEELADAYVDVPRAYHCQINTALRNAGLPEVLMPKHVHYEPMDTVKVDGIPLKPVLVNLPEKVFRHGIGASLGWAAGSGLLSLIINALKLGGMLKGWLGPLLLSPAAPYVAGVVGVVLGITISGLMITGQNVRSYAVEFERRVRETVAAVAAAIEREFNKLHADIHYALSDTLSTIEAKAKKHISTLEAQSEEYAGKTEEELAKIDADLERLTNEIEALLAEYEPDGADGADTDTTDADTDTTDADTDTTDADTDTTDADTPENADADTPTDADAEAVETDPDDADADTTADVDANAEDVDKQ